MPPTTKPSATKAANSAQGRTIKDFFKPPAALPRRERTGDSTKAKSNVTTSVSSARRPVHPTQPAGSPAHDTSEDECIVLAPARRPQPPTVLEKPEIPTAPAPPPKQPVCEPALQQSQQQTITADAAASISFSSTITTVTTSSTLSSIPQSPQSFSRRVIRNGWQAVLNSDSGSADSDSDDLPDLENMISGPMAKRRKLSPDATARKAVDRTAPATVISHGARAMSRSVSSGPPPAPRPIYKHSIAKIARETRLREDANEKLRAAEEAFAQQQRHREMTSRDDRLQTGLNVAVAEDSDEGERMRLAVLRTEALQEEERFLFFEGAVASAMSRTEEIPPKLRTKFTWLRDEKSWELSCVSGFVAEAVEKRFLSDESVFSWMAAKLLDGETSEELCAAYVEILRVAVATGQYKGVSGLDSLYQLRDVRARDGAQYDNELGQDHGRVTQTLPPGFCYALQLLDHSHVHWTTEQAARNVVDLALAAIDENVKADASMRARTQNVIENVLRTRSDEEFRVLCNHVYDQLVASDCLSLEIRARVISNLAASSHRSRMLRRQLALRLIVGNSARGLDGVRTGDLVQMTDKGLLACTQGDAPKCEVLNGSIKQNNSALPFSSLACFDLLSESLRRDPVFAISDGTNYALLTSLIAVLDIAIGGGFGRPLQPETTTLKSSAFPTYTASTSGSEQAFNHRVDALAAHIRLLISRIRDAGAAHLRRTEAKSALERLAVRLEHGVRTREKTRAAIFVESSRAQQGFLQEFVDSAARKKDSGHEVSQDDSEIELADPGGGVKLLSGLGFPIQT